MRKLTFCLLALMLLGSMGYSQDKLYLNINHLLGTAPFQLGSQATNNLGDTFTVERLQYYISDIYITHDGFQTTKVPDSWILVDASQPTNVLLGNRNFTIFEGIEFAIGVDSAHNHLDPSQYSLGHPLAPQSPSMHWGWSSGYRFVAMEGKSGANQAQTYEIHALEDQNYFYQSFGFTHNYSPGDYTVSLDADYTEALHGIDVSTGPISHGGSGIGVTILENFRDRVFRYTVTTSADPGQEATRFTAMPNPSNGSVTLHADQRIAKDAEFVLMDALGRELQKAAVDPSGMARMEVAAAGYYFVGLRHHGRVMDMQRLIITR